ncbi:hypothetical protein [Tsukamurella spumae]|uniref:Uncharacterized protein n=1 Tax=Tsukamurella spumae TaxID=44753 RepID=A0A846WZ97_9ACTN|nr:hypothetical protein [Tsukamurella spumae]NKY17080.1 hypothetical protein [Tsukamurella spumae]
MQAQAWIALGAALAAFVIAIVTLAQKHRADNRKEWWVRFQWALALAFSGTEAEQSFGWRILEDLTASPLITGTESGLVTMVGDMRTVDENDMDPEGQEGME